MLLYGIMPAIAGGLVLMDVTYIIKNIRNITTGSGWPVVWYFMLCSMEVVLVVLLLYELGKHEYNSNKWIAYSKEKTEHNNDSSSKDNETSDEAADT